MAIVFQTPIPSDKWLFSHNNLITEFNSDSIEIPLYCDITITGLIPLRIYPLPDNSFYVNLKDYISSLLNNYADDINLTVDPLDIDSFVKDWSRVLFNSVIDFTITFENETIENATVTPYVMLGSENIYKYKRGETVQELSQFILSPLKDRTANRFYLKYWDGYPFDIGLSRNIPTEAPLQTIKNNTNGITSPSIVIAYDCNRLVISDGDTTESLEDYLPLVEGYNELELAEDSGGIFIDLVKDTGCSGVYLKWLNKYGGYSYWLFNRFFQIDKRIRDLGQINNDFNNLDSTISTSKQIGKESFDEWKLLYDTATSEDKSVLQGIYTSPKVYLFTGEKFTKNNFNDWLEIKVVSNGVNLQTPKQDNNDFEVRIELPNDYNISL